MGFVEKSGTGASFDPYSERQLADQRRQQVVIDEEARIAERAAIDRQRTDRINADTQARSQVIGVEAVARQEDRDMVEAAIRFHLGLGYSQLRWSGLAPKMVDRWFELFGNDSVMNSALVEDVNALYALTDKNIADAVARGQDPSQFGTIWDSIAEISWAVGAEESTTQLLRLDADNVKGTFDALTFDEILEVDAAASRKLRAEGGGIGDVIDSQGLIGALRDRPGAWSYDPDLSLLALTIGTGENQQTVAVKTTPGFDPRTTLDVVSEVIVAIDDPDRHQGTIPTGKGFFETLMEPIESIGRFAEGHPSMVRGIDGIWELLGEIVSPASSVEGTPFVDPGPFERSQRALAARQEEAAEVQRLTSAGVLARPRIISFPQEAFVAEIMAVKMAESDEMGVDLTSTEALTLASDIISDPRVRQELNDDWDRQLSAQVIEEFKAEADETSPVRELVDATLGKVLTKFEAYDAFTQTIGLYVIDLFADLGAAGVAALPFGEEDLGEGFDRFTEAFEAPTESNVAEYFNLEGGNADLALLAVGIGFDPVNLFFPGSAGARGLFRKALTNPRYAEMFVRSAGIRSLTGQIAEATGESATRKALSNVVYLAAEGVDEVGIRELTRLALSPTATAKEVEAVIIRNLPSTDGLGWYLSAGPNRAIRHSTIEGFGRMVESLTGGKLNKETMDQIFDLTAQLSRTNVVDLGENMGLANFLDLVHMNNLNDPDELAKWLLRATEEGPTQTVHARAGVEAATQQQAKQKANALGRWRRRETDRFDLGGARQNLDELKKSLRTIDDLPLDEAGKERARITTRRAIRTLQDDIAESELRFGTYEASLREANRTASSATRHAGDLAAQPTRLGLAELFFEFYDDLAVKINKELIEQFPDGAIPILKDSAGRAIPNDLAPLIPKRDWQNVTGVKRGSPRDTDVRLVEGLALDDRALEAELTAIGTFNRTQRVKLPASAYEITLFRRIATQSPLYKAWQTAQGQKQIPARITRGMKILFGMNLLLNPITMAKVTLDETLRFFATTGSFGKGIKSTLAGLPGAGATRTGLSRLGVFDATSVTSRRAGEIAPVLRKIPGWEKLENASGSWVTNPWALQYRRTHEGFLSAGQYQWIARGDIPKEEYVRQVERWVNGTLTEDPVFGAYAKFLPDAEVIGPNQTATPQRFVDWWQGSGDEIGGNVNVRSTEIVVGEKTVMLETDADFVWETVERAFNTWSDNMIEEGQKQVLKRRLLETAAKRADKFSISAVDTGPLARRQRRAEQAAAAAAGQEPISGPDVGLLLAIKRVPGVTNQGNSKFVSTLFNGGFGNPSGRRSGVFFEYFYDEAQGIYRKAYGNKNRLLNDEVLRESLPDATDSEILEMLGQGAHNAQVRGLLNNGSGMVTEQQIEAQAARYAGLRADDLMYRFTAGSLAGAGVESALLFPFARAQMDFISWWSAHLTQPLQLREGLAKVLPRAVTETLESVPINARAWTKYAHLTTAVNNEYESPIDSAIKELTFFPFRFSSEFFIDILPQPGPIPSWIINGMGESGLLSEDVVSALQTFAPTLEYVDENEGWIDLMFPQSRRSVRDLTVGMTRAIAGVMGQNPNDWEEGVPAMIYNFMAINKVPAATGDFTVAAVAEDLKENAWGSIGDEEWLQRSAGITLDAAIAANRNDLGQDFNDRLNPLAERDYEYRALSAYGGMLDDDMFTILNTYSILGPDDLFDIDGTPRVQAVYEKWKAGEATREDRVYLADALVGIFFEAGRTPIAEWIPNLSVMDLLIINNPEIAVNLVSKSQCSGVPIRTTEHRQFHNAHCSASGRLQEIPEGPDGTETVSNARARGWIIYRQSDGDNGWHRDAQEAAHASARKGIDGVWFYVTGKEWRGKVAKNIAGQRVTVDAWMQGLLEPTGLDLGVGSSMTVQELHDALGNHRDRYKTEAGAAANLLDRGPVKQQMERHPFGQVMLDNLKQGDDAWREEGVDTFEDWSEEAKQDIRGDFGIAIDLGILTLGDYQRHVQPFFGELNYQPPVPPKLAAPEAKDLARISITPEQISDHTIDVLDGDTLSLTTADGILRVRIVGINSPEATQEGYAEATSNLQGILAFAKTVDLVMFHPELFGVSQLTAPGEERLLLWLYIDGVPIYDPTVFGSDNPTGAGVGGEVTDLAAILKAGTQPG